MRIVRMVFFISATFIALWSSSGRLSCFCAADEPDAAVLFSEGNKLYGESEYDKALKEYGRIIASGKESGNLYYNIGNCYFKKGQLGRAILNYERARMFIPGDKDLESNYGYCRSLVRDSSIHAAGGSWVMRLMDMLWGQFSVNGLTVFVSVVYLSMVLLLTLCLYLGRVRRYLLPGLIVFFVVIGLSSARLSARIKDLRDSAVVVVKNAEARFEPFSRATVHFSLPEGAKVRILENKDGWCKVQRSDGRPGWVRKDSIEKL